MTRETVVRRLFQHKTDCYLNSEISIQQIIIYIIYVDMMMTREYSVI